jgi:hypothetical protein
MNDDLGAFGTDTYDQDSTQGVNSKIQKMVLRYNGGSRELWIDRYNDERCAK